MVYFRLFFTPLGVKSLVESGNFIPPSTSRKDVTSWLSHAINKN